ncbi:MAG TPA: 16S rRNA (guanine(966)-N(2))-methyltransferase RsmD [Jiangellaceae bacterium]
MTRIIAGSGRGRRLAVPAGRDVRPTSDRVREALFSTVESQLGSLAGRSVIDLYAGSGALGLEALSRGAAYALLVESDARAVRAIRANIASVGLSGAEVAHAAVQRTLRDPPAQQFDLVLADPPYTMAEDDLTTALSLLCDGWLRPDALVVVERPSRTTPLLWPACLMGTGHRRYGETMLWYGRPAG